VKGEGRADERGIGGEVRRWERTEEAGKRGKEGKRSPCVVCSYLT